MSNLILHCGAKKVTRAEVEAVPVPARTATWNPVPYADLIDFMHEQADRRLGLPVVREQYGLNQDGNQLFALLTLKTDREDNGLAIGMRQSYNKTLRAEAVAGSQVFVCDNLAFSGSALKVSRKNTLNVWRDFTAMMAGLVEESLGHYTKINRTFDRMKEIPVTERRGYALLGVARGEGVLTAGQANIAFEDWETPRHEEFADRNLWGLYNCFTEGLKKGTAGERIGRQVKAHDWFDQFLGAGELA